MTSPTLVNIKKAQKEYLAILSQYKDLFGQEDVPPKQIAPILDEINCFWRERLESIDFELRELTETNSCFLLSGAIYLNVPDNEHYYFKSLGDYHLLPDPFLKMGALFRVPDNIVVSRETVDYLKKVFKDTLLILEKHGNHFFILPTRELAVKDNAEHQKILDTFFARFVSEIVKRPISSVKEFCETHKSFEEIENAMDGYVRDQLKYSDSDETGMSLREKINHYCDTQMSFKDLAKNKPESEVFWVVTYSWVAQVIDILLICLRLNVCPYIRFEVTFHYLALLMDTFMEDKDLKKVIETSIVFYILRKTIDEDKFECIEFDEFCARMKSKALLATIMAETRAAGIDISKGGIKQLQAIITKEFDAILANAS